MKFLRMGFIDNYNKTMGDVDIADQLRGSYRFDMWVRNRKWWWSIFFWGFGVLVTNAYVCYSKVCDENNIPKKKRRSHLEFRKDLAIAWIDPEYFWRYLESNKVPHKRKSAEEAISPITLDSAIQSIAKRRCTAITELSLDPNNGSLKCRLSRNGIDHMHDKPLNGKDSTRCQLHRWLGFEYCKYVSFCRACNVHLCVSCYRLFHTEIDIVGQKTELQQRLKPRILMLIIKCKDVRLFEC